MRPRCQYNGGMVRVGDLELGSTPRIADAVTDREVGDDAQRVKDVVDVFELRIDRFARHDPAYVGEITAAARRHGVPLVATVRAADEGGEAVLSDDQRLDILTAIAPAVDAIDIEMHAAIRDPVVALARRHDKRVIMSFHDFNRTPRDDDLIRLIHDGKRAGADIVKLATTATRRDDVDRLLGLLRAHRAQQLIIIAMGPEGVVSRVLFPLFGSLLTWGFLQRQGAPGQLPLDELVDALCRYAPDFARRHGR